MQPAAQHSGEGCSRERHEESRQLVAQAIRLAEAGDAAGAIPLFQQAAQLDPSSADTLDMLAQCCMEAGMDGEAHSAARAACQLAPRCAGALCTLGRAARNVGELKEAEAAFEAALAALGEAPDGGEGSPSGAGEVWQGLQQELGEVRELRQHQVGHAVGLPGLRIREAPANSQLGPGAAVWDSGVLLARLLVSCSSPPAQQGAADGPQATGTGHACTAACQGAAHACGIATAAAAAAAAASAPAAAAASTASPAIPPVPLLPAAPLPGLPTFALPPEAPQAAWLAGGPGVAPPPASSSVLAAPAPSLGSFLADARVLELGSGTGVVGIAAGCLGAHVLATDLPDVLPLLRQNIQLNEGLVAAAGGSVAAAALDWEVARAAQAAAAGDAGVEVGDAVAAGVLQRDGGGGSAPAAKLAPDLLPEGWSAPDWVLGADLVYSAKPVPGLLGTLASLVGGGAAAGGLDGISEGGNGHSNGSGSSSSNGSGTGVADGAAGQARGEAASSGVRLLLAHKRRHEEVDAALLEGLRAAGVPMRAVARGADSSITVYGNAAAVAALGL